MFENKINCLAGARLVQPAIFPSSLQNFLRQRPGFRSAIGQNPVGYLIPCHRVIQATGALGDYHWGADRKRAILALERARQEPAV